MKESITSTSTAVSAYAEMTKDALLEGIKKESSKARTRGQQMVESMRRIGEMLIEMKRRVPHGNFISSASWQTNLPERTIQRYMQMAKGVAPHRTVKDRERGHRKENLEVLRLTEFLPDDGETKPDTVSVLPAVEPPAPRPPSRPAGIVVDAEIVEPALAVDADPPIPEPGVALVYARTASDALNKIPKRDPSRKAAIKMISDWVNRATPSPAPSLIETSETTLEKILALLPRLRPAEVTELHRVIESRWMNHPAPAPVDHLAACWASASPEDRAVFLETCHLAPIP